MTDMKYPRSYDLLNVHPFHALQKHQEESCFFATLSGNEISHKKKKKNLRSIPFQLRSKMFWFNIYYKFLSNFHYCTLLKAYLMILLAIYLKYRKTGILISTADLF